TTDTLIQTPHPCSMPLPASFAARGITATTHTFLVDYLPQNYPYLPFRHHRSTSAKLQIAFFILIGTEDTPPTDLTDRFSFGDIYVSYTSKALYAYLPANANANMSDELEESSPGAWTRWSAVSSNCTRNLKGDEAGLLGHPYFPYQFLWPMKKFGWYSVASINNTRREVRTTLQAGDLESAGRAIVARTMGKHDEVGNAKRKVEVEGGEKKVPPQKKARKMLLEKDEGTPSVQPGERQNARSEWDEFYAKPRNNTRRSKERREQAAASAKTLGELEAEVAALRATVDALTKQTQEQQRDGAVKRLESENAALKARVEALDSQLNEEGFDYAKERMPIHPEFLDLMCDGFGDEMMKSSDAQRVAAENTAADGRSLLSTHVVYPSDTVVSLSPSSSAKTRLTALETKVPEAHRAPSTILTTGKGTNVSFTARNRAVRDSLHSMYCKLCPSREAESAGDADDG
ncbi:hypothetical protein R3P38DRAFT_2500459, partial [Favolaschia claudopus]